VHLENQVTVGRPLTVDDPLDLQVRAERLRAHPKGTLVDLVTTVDVAGERAWKGRSTYLRRGPGTAGAEAGEPAPVLPDRPPAAVWRLPAGLGRSYAAVSGDVNPIHLHPLTARAMGFPRAIAHGMWTYARCLAAIGHQADGVGASHVWFARPVLLPSTVELVRDDTHEGGALAGLRGAHSGRQHLALVLG
jgi:acyl dehydratase